MAKFRPAEALRNELISFSDALKVDNKFPVKSILNIFLFMAEEAFIYKGSGEKKFKPLTKVAFESCSLIPA